MRAIFLEEGNMIWKATKNDNTDKQKNCLKRIRSRNNGGEGTKEQIRTKRRVPVVIPLWTVRRCGCKICSHISERPKKTNFNRLF
jgi:hypothetical protein